MKFCALALGGWKKIIACQRVMDILAHFQDGIWKSWNEILVNVMKKNWTFNSLGTLAACPFLYKAISFLVRNSNARTLRRTAYQGIVIYQDEHWVLNSFTFDRPLISCSCNSVFWFSSYFCYNSHHQNLLVRYDILLLTITRDTLWWQMTWVCFTSFRVSVFSFVPWPLESRLSYETVKYQCCLSWRHEKIFGLRNHPHFSHFMKLLEYFRNCWLIFSIGV